MALELRLKNMIYRAEELGWTYNGMDEEESGRCFIELENESPAGEDLNVSIEFDKGNQVESFLNSLWNLYDDFDVDDHIEMWIEARHNGVQGVPSVRRLCADAEDILAMYETLYSELYSEAKWIPGKGVRNVANENVETK